MRDRDDRDRGPVMRHRGTTLTEILLLVANVLLFLLVAHFYLQWD